MPVLIGTSSTCEQQHTALQAAAAAAHRKQRQHPTQHKGGAASQAAAAAAAVQRISSICRVLSLAAAVEAGAAFGTLGPLQQQHEEETSSAIAAVAWVAAGVLADGQG
jgi:hypothetical protein